MGTILAKDKSIWATYGSVTHIHVTQHPYELTHNWGHVNGESFNFYILTMIAFYIHQIFELTDQLFQLCRRVCVTYSDLWEELCGLFRLMLFESWEHMLVKCMENNGVDPPTSI